jgi:hypothetical protein
MDGKPTTWELIIWNQYTRQSRDDWDELWQSLLMPQQNDKRRIKLLYVGLGTWFLICLNALRLASRVPYQAFVLGGVINIAVLVTFILALRNAYRRLECELENKSSQQAHTTPTHD